MSCALYIIYTYVAIIEDIVHKISLTCHWDKSENQFDKRIVILSCFE